MDEDQQAITLAFGTWLLGSPGGAAALHWGLGWSWWWAVPVALVCAALVGAGLGGLYVFVCILLEEDAWWLLGWPVVAAALHWGLGWSWWWAVPVALFTAYCLNGGLILVRGFVCNHFPSRWGRQSQDSPEPEDGPKPPAWPPHAAPVMDDLAKKIFAQLDDPMPGQRAAALEKLRARLAKDGRTFRDLAHELEARDA